MNKTKYRPAMTACDAVLLVCCMLVKNGKTVVTKESIAPAFYEASKDASTAPLFEDIAIQVNSDSIVSVDIEDSLAAIMVFGGFSLLAPSFEKMLLTIPMKDATEYIAKWDAQYRDAAELVSSYVA